MLINEKDIKKLKRKFKFIKKKLYKYINFK